MREAVSESSSRLDCRVVTLKASSSLPIDAKFPLEDYERLITAVEAADADGVANASKALENRLKFAAKTISEKYIAPPRTTDFAILFLPTGAFTQEVLRRPGLFEQLQRDYHAVTLTGLRMPL